MKRDRKIHQDHEVKEQNRSTCGARKDKVEGRETADSGGDFPVKVRKKRPRGRPWPKGVSGNPAGRPRGAKNKFTLAMLEGIRRAEEKLAQPKIFDPDKPHESWDGYYLQEGLWFAWDPLRREHIALPDQDPAPKPPARFDPAERRTEMIWKGRLIYVQHGWPFDPATWKRLKS